MCPPLRLTFTLADGTVHKGAWLICDNGYHQWPVLQFPAKYPESDEMAYWSKRLESVRKDVECVFGIIKQRHRLFRTTVQTTRPLESNLLWPRRDRVVGASPDQKCLVWFYT